MELDDNSSCIVDESGRSLFQPRSLFDIAGALMCTVLVDGSLIERLRIPKEISRKLRKSVKKCWMIDLTPLRNVDTYNYSKINLYDMNRENFNMVMCMDSRVNVWFANDIIPDSDYYHVVKMYWKFTTEQGIYRICEMCYKVLQSMSVSDVSRLWGEKKTKWCFGARKTHTVVERKRIHSCVLWNEDSYCDVCIRKTLFRLYDGRACNKKFGLHMR